MKNDIKIGELRGASKAALEEFAVAQHAAKELMEKDKTEREGRLSEATFNAVGESLKRAERMESAIKTQLEEEDKVDADTVKGLAAESVGKPLSTLDVMSKEDASSLIRAAIVTPSDDPDIKLIKNWNDTLFLMDAVKSFEHQYSNKPYGGQKSFDIYRSMRPLRSDLRKAMDTLTSGEGSQWTTTEFSSQLISIIDVIANVVNLFPSIDIPRGRKSITVPRLSAHAQVYGLDQNVSVPAAAIPHTVIGTENVELTPKVFATRVPFSYEFEEDCILAAIDIIRGDIGTALGLGIEDAVLNGSTLETDMDNADTIKLWAGNIAEHLKHFDGIRKNMVTTGVTKVAMDSTNFTYAKALSVKGNMGVRYGLNFKKGVWITGGIGYIKLLGLPEVVTIEKYGPAATVVSGEIGKLAGSPAIVSEKIYENLASTGLYTGTGSTTLLLYLFTDGFLVGNKRDFTVELTKEPAVQQYEMVATIRKAFTNRYASTEKVVNAGINIS
jgi:hypothetical protein